MSRGSKTSYSNKQRRMARHIEDGYLKDGRPRKTAERIAWSTVNKETGGARKSAKSKGTKGRSHAKNAGVIAKRANQRRSQIAGRSASR